jgi:hypothetical protein
VVISSNSGTEDRGIEFCWGVGNFWPL